MPSSQLKTRKVRATGWFDFHVHLCRALTYDDIYFRHDHGLAAYDFADLLTKQSVTGVLHNGLAYTEDNLRVRMERVIKAKIKAGEIGMNAIVDCSPDVGERAFRVALALRDKYAKENFEINVLVYPIFGLKYWGSDRQRLIEELVGDGQGLVALPERDARPNHQEVGFDGHLHFMIDLAVRYQLPLQVHVDQTNTPNEDGTERLINAVYRQVTCSSLPKDKRPEIWAVHMISPSCYDEPRFRRLVDGLLENDIGVVVCPIAAITMWQDRNQIAPIHNSIARVLELALAGVKLRFGTDNINDIFIPLPNDDLSLRREWLPLAWSERFFISGVIDKLFAGQPLTEADRYAIRRSLRKS